METEMCEVLVSNSFVLFSFLFFPALFRIRTLFDYFFILTELLKVVDEEGVDFSGREKQKLALARALYKNAPIVVLDEPTSALDAIAEQRLYQSFDKMIGEKSAVYISHRLASTRFCDKVAMFKGGEMIEYGAHEELMEQNGEYAHMFELQAQYYQEEGEENA